MCNKNILEDISKKLIYKQRYLNLALEQQL